MKINYDKACQILQKFKIRQSFNKICEYSEHILAENLKQIRL